MNIVYIRCSTNHQDTAHQLESIKHYCSINNITIDDIIEDEGISAYSTSYEDRKINKILNTTQNVENLIIFEPSRLSRQMIEGQEIIHKLTMKGVKIHSVKDNCIINKNELDNLLNAFRYFQANEESRNSSKRIKSAKQLQMERHEYLGGRRVLFGYEVINKHLVVIEDKREVVKNIFNIYINSGCVFVSDYLESVGVGRKENQIIHQMLRNKTYIGYPYKESDIFVEELKIVDLDTFNKAQEKMHNRKLSDRNGTYITAKSNCVLESLIFHACGKKMTIDYNKTTQIFRSRKCGCNYKKTFKAKEIIDTVENEIFNYFNHLDIDKLKEQYIKQYQDKQNMSFERLSQMKQEKRELEKTLKIYKDKLDVLILDVNINVNALNLISNKVSELENKIKELTNEIDLYENELYNQKKELDLSKLDLYNNLESIYMKADIQQRKLIMNTIIDKVIIRDYDDMTIYLKYNVGQKEVCHSIDIN